MRVLLFAHLKQIAGKDHLEIVASGPLSADQLWTRLFELCPALAAQRPHLRLARNWEYAEPNDTFAPADEVALIPPVSGG